MEPQQKIGAFKGSFMLMKASWNVLRKDKEMLWFPVLATIASIIALVGVVLLFIAVTGMTFSGIDEMTQEETAGGLEYLFIFVYYLVTVFIATFSQVGIAAITRARLTGGDFTFSQGFNAAWNKMAQIFVWSAVAATVGLILRLIAERSQALGKIVAGLSGAAWGILTFFIVPVLAFEERGIKDSLTESARVFKARWGETLVMNIGLGMATMIIIILETIVLVAVVVALMSLLGDGAASGLIFAIGVLVWFVMIVLTSLVQSVLQTIFKVVLYDYAKTGNIPPEFPRALIEGAVKDDGTIHSGTSKGSTSQSPPPFVPKA